MVFGPDSSGAMLKAWGVDKTIPRLLPVNAHPTHNGKPLGFEEIGRGKKAVNDLLELSKKGLLDDMEDALNQIPDDCLWKHLPAYKCLALAGSPDDREEVRDLLVEYAKDMLASNDWDPAILFSASRAANIQGWSTSTRHILLALYLALFSEQAMAFMSHTDHLFWENSGISDDGSDAKETLLSKKAVESKKKSVLDEWTSLKQCFTIQSASMDELMKLTGLQQVKLEAVAIVKKLLSDQKFKKQQRVVTTCNFAFMGNPGTGVHVDCVCGSVCIFLSLQEFPMRTSSHR